jgi:autotransporter-associated beta strand protein
VGPVQWMRDGNGVLMLCAAAARRWLTAALLAGASLAFANAAQAQYTVINNNDSGAGSLRQAIADANTAGGTSTITFSTGYTSGATILLSSELPTITTNVTINGNGFNPIISGNTAYRPFLIGDAGQNTSGSGTDSHTYAVTLQNLSVTAGTAQGGNGADGGGGGAGLGGAVLVTSNGALTLSNVSLTSNQAKGGAGTAATINSSGGGGGMGGNGALNSVGGGGGGLLRGTDAGFNGAGGGANGGAYGNLSNGGPGGFGGGGGSSFNPNASSTAGSGGFGGGGGGAFANNTSTAGSGGYGGGGGAATNVVMAPAIGGDAGFGGGGGGAISFGGGGVGTAGSGGFGGGAGAEQTPDGGGGGLGAGGAVYVQSGGSVTVSGSLIINGNSVSGGSGGGPNAGNGSGFGGGIFFQSTMGTPSTLSLGAGTQTIGDVVADYIGSGGLNPSSGSNTSDQGGSLMLAKTGAGVLMLSGANTYSGGTTVTGSTLVVTNSTATGVTVTSSSIGTGALTLDGGTLQVQSGTGPLTFGNGATITTNGATFDANGEQLTWNGVVSNAAGIPPGTPGTLTIASTIGGGVVTLTNANTYTGGTVINSGATLALSGFGDISNSSSVTANGTFDISGTTSSFVPIKTLAGSGQVYLGSNGLVITAGSTEFSGVISDGGNFGGLEIVHGTQTLSGVNTYLNETQIDSGAKLALKGNGSIAFSNVAFSGGTGTLDISQANGGTSVGGLFSLFSASRVSLGAQTLTITNGSFFYGVIQDGGIAGGTGGGLTIAGNAVQQLGGTNTYTGLTTINATGELDLINGSGGHTGSIATSKAVINNGIFDISGLGNGVTPVSTSIQSLSGTNAGAIVFLGVNQLVLTNASGTYGGSIQDGLLGPGGSLALTGGKEVLTGASTYTGPTTVTGGTLQIDGSITPSSVTVNAGGVLDVNGAINGATTVTINAGGMLTGNGTVDPLTVAINNGATFAPGNGTPGTSTAITGNLALQSGAIYLVMLNPSVASFANVTGTATLGGAGVNAIYANGSYVSKQYTILTAGSVSGTFGSLVNSNLPANFSTSLSYDPTHAYLDLTLNFTPGPNFGGGLNGNQQVVAHALSNFFNASGGIPLVFGTLTPAGLTQASGELATGSQQATFDAMNLFLGLLTDPFVAGRGDGATSGAVAPTGYASSQTASAPRDAYAMFTKAPVADTFAQRWSVWAAGYGGSQTTDGNAALGSNTATSSIAGTAVGADYRFSPDTLAGFALAGGGTSFSVANAGSGHSDLFQAGAFVRHTAGPAYISAALAYGWQDVTTNRTVTIAGTDQLRAEFNANTWSGRLESGYRYLTPWLGITPYAAGQFTTFDLPSYAESALSGASTFALNYSARSVTDSRSELGIRTDKSWAIQDAILTLRGRLAWAHDFDPDRSIAATFQALPGASFVVNGAAQASDSALTTASAEIKWSNGWSAAATFEGEFSDVTNSYAGKGVARYAW